MIKMFVMHMYVRHRWITKSFSTLSEKTKIEGNMFKKVIHIDDIRTQEKYSIYAQ